MTRNDLTGVRFGSLVAVEDVGRAKDGQVLWRCRCDCGATHQARAGKLRTGEVTSCGCQKSRKCREVNIKHGLSAQGGMTPEYRTWANMIDRCENPRNKQFADYGGRGVRLCDEWRHSVQAFVAYMGKKPSSRHSIDRIDVNGNYEPGNCRWSTPVEQNRNKRNTRRFVVDGREMTIPEAAHSFGVAEETIRARLKRGLSPIEAVALRKLNHPARRHVLAVFRD